MSDLIYIWLKFVLSEKIAKAWIGLVKQIEQEDISQGNEQESCINNNCWKWISSHSHLTPVQLDLFEDPKMHDDKPKRDCAEIKWHPKSIIEARKCTVPHADGVICQIP